MSEIKTPLTSRRALLVAGSIAALAGGCASLGHSAAAPAARDTDVTAAMKRATRFMREKAAAHGGYVWSYSADFSQRWGEMEAFPSMIWIQPPGTATVGHLYLDC